MEAVTYDELNKFFDGSSPYGDDTSLTKTELTGWFDDGAVKQSPESITVHPGDSGTIPLDLTIINNGNKVSVYSDSIIGRAIMGNTSEDTSITIENKNTIKYTIGLDETGVEIQFLEVHYFRSGKGDSTIVIPFTIKIE